MDWYEALKLGQRTIWARRRGPELPRGTCRGALEYRRDLGVYFYLAHTSRDLRDGDTPTESDSPATAATVAIDARDGRLLGVQLPRGQRAANTITSWLMRASCHGDHGPAMADRGEPVRHAGGRHHGHRRTHLVAQATVTDSATRARGAHRGGLLRASRARLVRHRTDSHQRAVVFVGQRVKQSVRSLTDIFEALMQAAQ